MTRCSGLSRAANAACTGHTEQRPLVCPARRKKAPKPAATREEAYVFAWGAVKAGHPDAAAAVCFVWLQWPENMLAG